jgi:hypothetical protein
MTDPGEFMFAMETMEDSTVWEFFELVNDGWVCFAGEFDIANKALTKARFNPRADVVE